MHLYRRLPLLVLTLAFAPSALAQKKPRHAPPAARAASPGASHGESKALNSLTVSCSTQNAEVYIDGDKVGLAPIALPVPIPNGNHTIKVTKLGFAPYVDVFTAKAGTPVKLDIELMAVAAVVHVRSALPGSRVLIDGKYVGDAPADVEVEVGARAVQVSKQCYGDFFKNVMTVAGQEIEIDAQLSELPPATNPCHVTPPPPPKWYQKKWVWGVIGGGAAVVAAAAIVIPIVAQPQSRTGDFNFAVGAAGMALSLGR